MATKSNKKAAQSQDKLAIDASFDDIISVTVNNVPSKKKKQVVTSKLKQPKKKSNK